jgi:hypothetical protein
MQAIAKPSRTRKAKDTTSSTPIVEDKAGHRSDDVVHSASSKQTTNLARDSKMSDATILEFQDDITNAEAPVPLPVGEYNAQITGAEVKTSAAGNQYINITLKVPSDEYPADYTDGDPDGVVLQFGRLMYSEKKAHIFQIAKFCKAIGAPTGKRIDLTEWFGLGVRIEVAHQDYEGEPRATVKKVIAQA